MQVNLISFQYSQLFVCEVVHKVVVMFYNVNEKIILILLKVKLIILYIGHILVMVTL